MRRVTVAAAALALALAGCAGGDDDAEPSQPPAAPPPTGTEPGPPPGPTQPPPPVERRTVSVYFLRDGKLAAGTREITSTPAVARAALEALVAGPTAAERRAGLTTGVPRDVHIGRLAVEGGTAHVELEPCPEMPQVVFTLTQFPTVRRVESPCLESSPAARADLESDTPAIFAESPTVGETVTSPLRLHGTANTFEATFQVEVLDAEGHVIGKRFATATSGSGTRGTFDVTVPFSARKPDGTLVVYEDSAKDGSRINVVRIPLRLQPG